MTDWADEWREEVATMTQLLRAPHSPPLWRDLRRQLQRRGFDAGEALVAESYEDDATNDEVGWSWRPVRASRCSACIRARGSGTT